MRKFDYIVVGSGLAGLYAAYKASFKGSVAVITKSFVRESNSFNAQGGIAAVTSFDDDPQIHKSDTLIAGRGLCEESAVDILVHEGPNRIEPLPLALRVATTSAVFFMREETPPANGLRSLLSQKCQKKRILQYMKIQPCWIF